MFVCKEGYIFEGRNDMNGDFGVIENYRNLNGFCKVITGVTANGTLAPIFYYNKDTGFSPLSDIIKSADDVGAFASSHRAVYARMGVACYLAVYTLGKRTADGEVTLYVPVKDVTSGGKPALACSLISTLSGVNKFKVNENLYTKLVGGVKAEIERLDLTDRKTYLSTRIQV